MLENQVGDIHFCACVRVYVCVCVLTVLIEDIMTRDPLCERFAQACIKTINNRKNLHKQYLMTVNRLMRGIEIIETLIAVSICG